MFLKLSIILIWSCLLVQGKMDCKSDGYFPNSDCTGFYQCVFTGTASAQQYYTACPSGLLFDAASILCNWASQVKCNSNNQVTTATRKTTTATTKKGDVTTLINLFRCLLLQKSYKGVDLQISGCKL